MRADPAGILLSGLPLGFDPDRLAIHPGAGVAFGDGARGDVRGGAQMFLGHGAENTLGRPRKGRVKPPVFELLPCYRIETRCPACHVYHEVYAPGTAARITCYACEHGFDARYQPNSRRLDDFRGSRV